MKTDKRRVAGRGGSAADVADFRDDYPKFTPR